jgi:hypothetical protein
MRFSLNIKKFTSVVAILLVSSSFLTVFFQGGSTVNAQTAGTIQIIKCKTQSQGIDQYEEFPSNQSGQALITALANACKTKGGTASNTPVSGFKCTQTNTFAPASNASPTSTTPATDACRGLGGASGVPVTTNGANGGVFSANAPAASTQAAANAKRSCYATSNSLGWVICPLLSLVDESLQHFDNWVRGVMEVKVSEIGSCKDGNGGGCTTSQKATTKEAWQKLSRTASILILLGTMCMVFSQAIGVGPFDNYTIKKMLPKLLVSIIMIQLSWWGCVSLLRASNAVSTGLGSVLTEPFGLNMSGGISQVITEGQDGVQGVGLLAVAGGAAIGTIAVLPIALSLIFGVILSLVFLTIRKILIVACIVMAPIAIAAWGIPGFDKVFKLWKETLEKLLMIGILLTFIQAMGRIMAFIIYNSGNKSDAGAGLFNLLGTQLAWYSWPFGLAALYKAAGSLTNKVFGTFNDKTKGLIDGQKKRSAAKIAANRTNFKAGNLTGGIMNNSRIAESGFGKVVNRVGAGAGAGAKGRFGFGASGKITTGRRAFANAQEFGKGGSEAEEMFNDQENKPLVMRALTSLTEEAATDDITKLLQEQIQLKFDTGILDSVIAQIKLKATNDARRNMDQALAAGNTTAAAQYRSEMIRLNSTDLQTYKADWEASGGLQTYKQDEVNKAVPSAIAAAKVIGIGNKRAALKAASKIGTMPDMTLGNDDAALVIARVTGVGYDATGKAQDVYGSESELQRRMNTAVENDSKKSGQSHLVKMGDGAPIPNIDYEIKAIEGFDKLDSPNMTDLAIIEMMDIFENQLQNTAPGSEERNRMLGRMLTMRREVYGASSTEGKRIIDARLDEINQSTLIPAAPAPTADEVDGILIQLAQQSGGALAGLSGNALAAAAPGYAASVPSADRARVADRLVLQRSLQAGSEHAKRSGASFNGLDFYM